MIEKRPIIVKRSVMVMCSVIVMRSMCEVTVNRLIMVVVNVLWFVPVVCMSGFSSMVGMVLSMHVGVPILVVWAIHARVLHFLVFLFLLLRYSPSRTGLSLTTEPNTCFSYRWS